MPKNLSRLLTDFDCMEHSIFINRSGTLNLINGVGGLFKKLGVDLLKLDADAVIQYAQKTTGFEFDTEDLRANLEQLIHSLEQDARPNTFGRLALFNLVRENAVARFRVEQHLARHPEITQADIKEPVFIIGMPRTGTTILHALMHEDPANRSPLAWECLQPFPAPTPETYLDNPNLQKVKRNFEQLFKLVPDFKKKHHLEVDAPQECLGITALDFNSYQFFFIIKAQG